jgi:hypothetical protein
MEKAIKLIMREDKSLRISVNDDEKHVIDFENRSIGTDKIYKIIDFSITDHYTVTSENESNIDSQVLEFFTGLFMDIVEKVNTLQK